MTTRVSNVLQLPCACLSRHIRSVADAMSLQGVGLCHGIAGSGYALLSHGRATGDARQLRRAARFAQFAADHWRELYPVPDAPASLFEVTLASYICDLLQRAHTQLTTQNCMHERSFRY